MVGSSWKTRDRLAGEQGTVIKDWGGRLPVALIYPNRYHVGMSNLGMQIIYRLLNDDPGLVCERVFLPDSGAKPGELISLESGRPLTDFALLAFSVTYELDYFNVAAMLRAAGLPLYAADRDARYPLVIGGGPCVSANPEPLAPFFDCLGIGEAEVILPPLLKRLRELPDDRRALLEELKRLPGVYVPLLKQPPVARQYLANLDDFRGGSAVLSRDTELGNLYLMEIERGCGWGCRFCLAGRVFRPVRFRSTEALLAEAKEGLVYRRRLGLVGAAVSDHPDIDRIMARLREMGAKVAVSSLRVNPLSPAVLKAVQESGTKTLALAPEAGSERLRRLIHKGVSGDDVIRAAAMVGDGRFGNIKLYFMIGLPTETDEDIDGIIRLTLDFRRVLEAAGSRARISLNVAPFVPKAGTPFQWLPMAATEVLTKRLARLKTALSPQGIRVKAESPRWSEVQTVLARGDRSLAAVLAAAWPPTLNFWQKGVADNNLDIGYYAYRRWDTSTPLPWSTVSSGAAAARLVGELDKALSGQE